MPFAPIALDLNAHSLFDLAPKCDYQYMTVACPATRYCIETSPAAIHPYDRTARPQILRRSANPTLAAILSEFEALTSRKVLINTSLNTHGEPLINTPAQASAMLLTDQLDFLILADHIISSPSLSCND